jgi:hypothetical protein
MIVLLYQRGCQSIAKSIASDLRQAFASHIKVALIAASLFFLAIGGFLG